MYVKINDYKTINTDLIQEVYIQNNNVYARINGAANTLYYGKTEQDAKQFLSTFITSIKAEQVDINKILNDAFPPEVKTLQVSPTSITQNGVVTITITLDKAVTSTSDITLNVDSKMTVKQALALNSAKTQATATYTATTVGTSAISAKTTKGKITKTAKVTITAAEAAASTSEFGKRALKD